MYYYQKKKKVKEGGGIFDSIISAVTSNVMKDVAKNVATKTLTEVGNRGSQKVIDKIIPPKILSKAQLTEGQIILPRKGRGLLTEESKDILNKYLTEGQPPRGRNLPSAAAQPSVDQYLKIQDYVKQ